MEPAGESSAFHDSIADLGNSQCTTACDVAQAVSACRSLEHKKVFPRDLSAGYRRSSSWTLDRDERTRNLSKGLVAFMLPNFVLNSSKRSDKQRRIQVRKQRQMTTVSQSAQRMPSRCAANGKEKLRTELDRGRELFMVTYEYESHIVAVQRERHDDVGLKYLSSLVNDHSLVRKLKHGSFLAHTEVTSGRKHFSTRELLVAVFTHMFFPCLSPNGQSAGKQGFVLVVRTKMRS